MLMLDALLAWCDRDASYRQDQRMKIAAMATDLNRMQSAAEALAKRLNVKLGIQSAIRHAHVLCLH